MTPIKISAAESLIMDAVWEEGALSAEQIVGRVAPGQGWGEATVRTLINRLLKKKALKSERSAGRTLYHPLVSREAYVSEESQGLLDRLFGGQLAPLVAHFAKNRNLSPEEVRRLKQLVQELDEDDR